MNRRFYLVLGLALILSLVGVQTSFAQGGLLWTTTFYNNEYLVGPSVKQTTVNSVNFNWGTDRPFSSVNADHFSARFSTAGEFAAGTYRFTMTADDGVHLIIDNNNVVIDTFDNPSPGQTITVDVPLTAGSHHLQVDYREVDGGAYVHLNWTNLGNVPAQPQPLTGSWTAQYFSNSNLSGSPFSTFSEGSPTHNWGYGAPLSNFPADNFSVRWTSGQYLNQGTYEFTVRADDGVRVRVDNVTVIDEWHSSAGAMYTGQIGVSSGNHTITVEYYENGSLAYIDYNLRLVNQPSPAQPQQPQPTATPIAVNARAEVTAGRLNFRSGPSINASILGKLSNGDIYPIIGRLEDSSWWQLNVNGTSGWVSGAFIRVLDASNVPVEQGQAVAAPAPTGNTLVTTANLSMRSGPAVSNSRQTVIPNNTAVEIVGRNASNTWWQVTYDRYTGWVSGQFVRLSASMNWDSIPVSFNN